MRVAVTPVCRFRAGYRVELGAGSFYRCRRPDRRVVRANIRT